ncbi:MAG: c-type cytochrome [Methylocystis sp.]|uniref:c-type cytochrome n=1 Tax=Methylocystis sp. TaxID=1911079 RepID=UPI003DA48391
MTTIRPFSLPILIAVAVALPSAAPAGENETLKGLLMECDTCHGINGRSVVPDQTPSLAGKSETYLLRQLQAFQAGKRSHGAMLIMGEKLTPREMTAIARHYARIKR